MKYFLNGVAYGMPIGVVAGALVPASIYSPLWGATAFVCLAIAIATDRLRSQS